jgi:hypothetical protein
MLHISIGSCQMSSRSEQVALPEHVFRPNTSVLENKSVSPFRSPKVPSSEHVRLPE